LADFDVQHRCNVLAPFALTQLFLPMLIKRHGYIVFINSTVGLAGAASLAQYSATKHRSESLGGQLAGRSESGWTPGLERLLGPNSHSHAGRGP
jgi:short-subunit dehydrogenase